MYRTLQALALASTLAVGALLATPALAAQAPIDVNRASQADLETIKGIGPSMSAKILNARKSGDFKSWADLVERVGGIGTANASRLSKAGLTVAGSAYTGPTEPSAKAYKAPKGQADKQAKGTTTIKPSRAAQNG